MILAFPLLERHPHQQRLRWISIHWELKSYDPGISSSWAPPAEKRNFHSLNLLCWHHGRRGATWTGMTQMDLSPTKQPVLHLTEDRLYHYCDEIDKMLILWTFLKESLWFSWCILLISLCFIIIFYVFKGIFQSFCINSQSHITCSPTSDTSDKKSLYIWAVLSILDFHTKSHPNWTKNGKVMVLGQVRGVGWLGWSDQENKDGFEVCSPFFATTPNFIQIGPKLSKVSDLG